MVTCAESCTGGMITAALTGVSGSSAVLDRGFTTYSNEAKVEMLAVPMVDIAKFGAVSAEVARAMAQGAVLHSHANIAISVTGIAGPGGGSDEKPVGMVWFGLARDDGFIQMERRFFPHGSRNFIRIRATEAALRLLLHGLINA